MASDLVSCERDAAVVTITLNRPERRNALTADMLEALLAAVEEQAADESVRVLVLTGAGSAFCVGGDLAAGLEGINGPPPLTSQTGRLRRFMRAAELLHSMPQVTIAAVNGACAGAGLSLACACDLRYAASSAVFNTAFLSAGVSGDFGGTWTLPRIVGSAKAREMYLLPGKLTVAEALRIGLVSDVFGDEELLAQIGGISRRLSQSAPLALRRVKDNLTDSERLPFAEHLDAEAARHAFCCATADAVEAARAFTEKRAPTFHGQ